MNIVENLKNDLITLYAQEKSKMYSSVQEYCNSGNPRGMEQMIGRRFGFFWEENITTPLQWKVH